MDLFGYTFYIGNKVGLYSFISFIILLILYFMRPKPFKKIIPSLIFLESGRKQLSMTAFFRKFVKDWIILVQIFLLLVLCLAALDLTTNIYFRQISKDVVFVIDASASSKATDNGKMIFDKYKNIARKRVGIRNSIILVKNTPEILAKQTNPANALRILSTMKPTDSLSNIWDAMMIAGDISIPRSKIIVLSDFIDSSNKDLSIAKRILEAKGLNVELINPKETELSNIGIIKYTVSGNNAIINVKNYDPIERSFEILNNDEVIKISPFSVEQFSVALEEGINEIEIKTKDDFKIDNKINIIIPKVSDTEVLFVTNKKSTFLRSAFESIKSLNIKKEEPPIVSVGNQKLFVLDNVNYNSLLPGTLDKIKEKVYASSSLIITAQDNFDTEMLKEILPVEIIQESKLSVEIINRATIEKFQEYDFGLSSKYYITKLSNNNSIVIAEANDKDKSPIIVLTKHGQGNILFYGIFDEHNPFKLNTQYPLFWVNMIELLTQKDSIRDINLKIGDIIYGEQIKDPEGKSLSEYALTDKRGIYKLRNKEIAVELLNSVESDINREPKLSQEPVKLYDNEDKTKQSVDLVPLLVVLALIISFLEIYFLKKRGDL